MISELICAVLFKAAFASPFESSTLDPIWKDGFDYDYSGEDFSQVEPENKALDGPTPPPNYSSGPLPIISDSLFSLIILIYVSVIFIFMFFSSCWKEPQPPPPDPALKNIPMITDILDEMEAQEREKQREEQFLLENGGTGENGEVHTEMAEVGVANGNGALATGGDADSEDGQGQNKILVNVITENLSPSAPHPPSADSTSAQAEATTDTPV